MKKAPSPLVSLIPLVVLVIMLFANSRLHTDRYGILQNRLERL